MIPICARSGATAAGTFPGIDRTSTIGRSMPLISAASASEIRAMRRALGRLATISAKGLPLRCFSARRRLTVPLVAGVACQMEAAQAFQRDDFPGAKARHDFLDPHGEFGAAGRAGGWLGMETAVARVVVFVRAVRAEGETRHGGLRPVIGQRAGDGVAGAAMGAVEEGIAPAAVLRDRTTRRGRLRRHWCPG